MVSLVVLLTTLGGGVVLGTYAESWSANRRPCLHGTVRTLIPDGPDGYDVVCAAPSASASAGTSCAAFASSSGSIGLDGLTDAAYYQKEYDRAVQKVYDCREDLAKYESAWRMCQAGRDLDAAASANNAAKK